jgi:hypothetical protein
MIYTDKYGRIHDKPTDGVNHSSGNGWIYSALAVFLGVPLELDKEGAKWCAENLSRHPYVTTVGADTSPISRDEVLGLAYLGYLKPEHLKGWSFSPFPIPSFNPIKLFKQAYSLVDWKTKTLKHRTTFWKTGCDQIYRFAFSVPLSDRHFLNKCWGRYNPFWHLVHVLAMYKQPTHRTSRMLRFLKTGKDVDAVANYFGEGHPLTTASRF